MYFSRTVTGERFGITTFAPARMPSSRPRGWIVPRAVVAGSRTFGSISRMTPSRCRVSSSVPAGMSRKGVS